MYTACHQHHELRWLKDHLQAGHIVIQEDFAENFSLKHQDEIMSAHWSSDQVTIFTAVVHYLDDDGRLEHKSYALVSDKLEHDKFAVYTFNKVILKHISLTTKIVTHVHYWSDGAASQFKNRFTLSNLLFHKEDFGSTPTWSFHETSHGKGPMDGVGGEVKRAVWRLVLQQRAVVTSAQLFAKVAAQLFAKVAAQLFAKVAAQLFAKVAAESSKRICVRYVSADTVQEDADALNRRWELVKPIPGTQSVHFVKPVDHKTLAVSRTSAFSSPTDQVLLEHKVLPSRITDDDHQTATNYRSTIPDHSVAPEDNIVAEEVRVNDFVLVKYTLPKSEKRYPAEVIHPPTATNETCENVHELFMQFLRQSEGGKGKISFIAGMTFLGSGETR